MSISTDQKPARTSMRGILKSGPLVGADYSAELPQPDLVPPGHVKVRVEAASVCGTDREIWKYSPAAQAFNLRLPVVMGHEGSGTVVEVGEGTSDFSPGDNVAFDSHIACLYCYHCRNGRAHLCENMLLLGLHIDGLFAEYCVVPVQATYKLPSGFDLETAALLEPAGVAMHALQEHGHAVLGKRVLITGGGPVGLFIAELCRLGGAASVVVVEPNPYRRKFAESLGAKTLEPGPGIPEQVHAMSTDRHGFDVGFEASGHPASFPAIAQSLRKGGSFVAVGFGSPVSGFDVSEYLNRRNITFRGSFGRLLWSTWDDLVVLIGEGKLDLAKFITHRLPLSEIERAVELLSGESCKVLLLPGWKMGSRASAARSDARSYNGTQGDAVHTSVVTPGRQPDDGKYRLDIKELVAFVTVAEELHFSRAAERLQMAQPPLSYRIQQLEKELKVRLFIRNTRSVTLTEAGERLLGPARKVLADVEIAKASVSSLTAGISGRVKIGFAGASSSKILPLLAQEVRRRYPGIDLVLQGQVYADAALDQVASGRLDMGFVRLPIRRPEIAYRVIEHERLICALPSSHPLAGRSEIQLEELAEDPFISFPAGSGSTLRTALLDTCAKAGVTPRIVQEAPDSYTILALVAAGAGATLTLTSVQHIQPTGVTYIPIAGEPIQLHAALAWRKDNVSPAIARILEICDEVLPEPKPQ